MVIICLVWLIVSAGGIHSMESASTIAGSSKNTAAMGPRTVTAMARSGGQLSTSPATRMTAVESMHRAASAWRVRQRRRVNLFIVGRGWVDVNLNDPFKGKSRAATICAEKANL